MRDILIVFIIIVFFLIGDYFMKNVDKEIESIRYFPTLLIYDEDTLHQIPKEVFEYCNCIDKNEEIPVFDDQQIVILLTSLDYSNLMLNYNIHRSLSQCKVYAICQDKDNYNLYLNEKIEIIEMDELLALVESLYEKNNS